MKKRTETLPRLPLRRVRVFNPAGLSSAETVVTFFARRPLFERLLAEVAAEPAAGRAQHHLVIGPSGMGKTTLLARLAVELRRAPHSARFVPIVLSEEQYALDRLSKFWMNCLESLAADHERRSERREVAAIDARVAKLRSRAPSAEADAEYARDVLTEFLAAAGGRRPVLLVDNLQLVFDRVGDRPQHVLREALMRPGAPIILGTSPSPPAQSQDYRAAFYDHFKTHYLRPLDRDEFRRLLLHLAGAAGRRDVAAQIAANLGRVATLHHLAGGSPRVAVILFQLYCEDPAGTAVDDLEQLLDRLTPLYQARFESLSPQMQVIAATIADHWDPVTSREITVRTGLAGSQVSPQLDRLQKLGFVEDGELYATAAAGYQLTDRLLNLWLLVRCGSRRQRRQIEWLARFLETHNETVGSPRSAVASPAAGRSGKRSSLQEALSAVAESNWGTARDRLLAALRTPRGAPALAVRNDWLEASAVLLKSGYGLQLLSLLEEQGIAGRARPWFEALRALQAGDRRLLLNVAPEIRTVAEWYFDEIERRRKNLSRSTRSRTPWAKSRGHAR